MPDYRSDPDLVRACLEGRQEAWNVLVDRYGRLVYSVARRSGLPPDQCDDVFQTVFTKLCSALGQLKDQTRLSAWLITTAHRESWRVRKREQTGREPASSGEATTLDPSVISAADRAERVRRALDAVAEPCRTLLSALFLRPQTPDYESLAAELGMRVGSIGPTRARCFDRLRAELDRLGIHADDLN
jgi:RNA polymerase sigma factor (sigma-70 family)